MKRVIFKPSLLGLWIVSLCFLSVSGCSNVNTYVNTFRAAAPEFVSSQYGTVYVQAYDGTQAQSLEFEHYQNQLALWLTQKGFRAAQVEAEATFIAHLDYEVVEREVDDPFDYHTYFGTHFDRHLRANIVVIDQGKQIEYVRTVAVVIKRAVDDKRIYEVTGVSRGGCGVMSVVFDEMIEAMFQGFPADSGSLKKVRVEGSTRC